LRSARIIHADVVSSRYFGGANSGPPRGSLRERVSAAGVAAGDDDWDPLVAVWDGACADWDDVSEFCDGRRDAVEPR
jgi:hypothetical protein